MIKPERPTLGSDLLKRFNVPVYVSVCLHELS